MNNAYKREFSVYLVTAPNCENAQHGAVTLYFGLTFFPVCGKIY